MNNVICVRMATERGGAGTSFTIPDPYP